MTLPLQPPPPRSAQPIGPDGQFTLPWYGFFTKNVQQNKSSAAGVYNSTFKSGYVQYAGPNNILAGDPNMIFGLALPNPSGTPGPGLLLGSGATPVSFWIIQDQAFTAAQAGNNLGITAGETQPGSTQPGGNLSLYGGGADQGMGGATLVQGGTSANADGGPATLAGGSATNGGIPGDVFVIAGAGQAPAQGANVHLIMTLVNGIAGDVRIRVNSNILIQFLQNGEIFLTESGTGAGLPGQPIVSGGLGAPATYQAGYSGTIVTAALTGGGTQGSMTFVQGILTAQVQAT
jgi:hypothetical protein